MRPIVKTAQFVVSNSDVESCPKDRLPEYAFIGRSNVGKSSIINMLAQKKGLAKTSNTPGKTKLINHFRINDNWYIVDLPGYGYAQISKKERQKLSVILEEYFLKRETLVNTFLLIDLRHIPQKIDLEFMEWLGESQIPFSIIFTKADKLTPNDVERNVETYKNQILASAWEELPPYFISSSVKGLGRTEILTYIESLNKSLKR